MTDKGMFIVVEGLEGAGKSTAIAVVDQYLKARFEGREIVHTREPGGTPLAEEIRAIWKQPREEAMAPMTELLMVYACRAQLVETVIKPALARGAIVVGDRHDLSSRAYQGGGRGLSEPVSKLSALTLGEFAPDLTLYLDIDPALGLSRARARGELDRIELEALGFFERARATYLDEARRDPRIVTIDASQPLEQVHQALVVALDGAL
ncbi:dTMP kinase [Ferrimonas balearica]|uniref:dTMP kinase n=1 Tax=Ferrimonas balearica TaxID=44012 RepID=UPI001C99F4B1|nr:dTMP kinase [Ferrimonas balearica]MBY5920465.1 dTMP kinase [Ferrimonas balearica]MBY5996850.1 dTMP kinase [Ferrimonas balearica]